MHVIVRTGAWVWVVTSRLADSLKPFDVRSGALVLTFKTGNIFKQMRMRFFQTLITINYPLICH